MTDEMMMAWSRTFLKKKTHGLFMAEKHMSFFFKGGCISKHGYRQYHMRRA
jgi:hypothetical protein